MANIPTIITIDGPVASGKSTVGFLFSQKINYQFIDAGWFYRAVTYLVIKDGLDINDDKQNEQILNTLDIQFVVEGKEVNVYLNGQNLTNELRTHEINTNVAIIGTKKKALDAIHKIERKFAEGKNTVMSGREIGTIVFPDAKLKFYMDAPVEERAARRFEQHKIKESNITLEDVSNEVIERDKMDMEREFSPLAIPQDAIIIQNWGKTYEETVEEMFGYYQKTII
ncbi:MAG: (d)CMP kinase [bacterium]